MYFSCLFLSPTSFSLSLSPSRAIANRFLPSPFRRCATTSDKLEKASTWPAVTWSLSIDNNLMIVIPDRAVISLVGARPGRQGVFLFHSLVAGRGWKVDSSRGIENMLLHSCRSNSGSPAIPRSRRFSHSHPRDFCESARRRREIEARSAANRYRIRRKEGAEKKRRRNERERVCTSV